MTCSSTLWIGYIIVRLRSSVKAISKGRELYGKGIIEQGRKKDVGVLIRRAHRPSTTDIDDYRHEEAGFPQGQWKSALLGQENAIMSPQEHENDAAPAGFAL